MATTSSKSKTKATTKTSTSSDAAIVLEAIERLTREIGDLSCANKLLTMENTELKNKLAELKNKLNNVTKDE